MVSCGEYVSEDVWKDVWDDIWDDIWEVVWEDVKEGYQSVMAVFGKVAQAMFGA